MKSIIRLFLSLTFLGSLAVNAQFISFATGQSYDYVTSQFGVGGEYEGLRHATVSEATFIVENYYGYDFSGDRQDANNANATFSILQDMGGPQMGNNVVGGDSEYQYTFYAFAFLDAGPEPNAWIIRHNFLPWSSEDSFTAGSIGDSWWPEGIPETYVGHFLVKNSSILPVPEPSTNAIVLTPLGLGIILFIRRRKFSQKG